MGNRLRELFNDSEVKNYLTISFENDQDSREFAEKMIKLWETGEPQKITGIGSVRTAIGDDVNRFIEGDTYENMHDIRISVTEKEDEYAVETEFGLKKLKYKYHFQKGKIVFETYPEDPIVCRLVYDVESHGGQISYHIQPGNGDSMKELVLYYSAILKVADQLYADCEKSDEEIPEQWSLLRQRLVEDKNIYYLLWKIEEKLNIHFDVKQMQNISEENWKNSIHDAIELYYAIIRRYPLRLRATLTATESTGVYLEEGRELKPGSEITLTYQGEMFFEIFGRKIKLYTANMLCDAVVKELVRQEDGRILVRYTDCDSQPMYVSYMAFLTEQEAAAEVKNIMAHESDYREAKTWDTYLQKENFLHQENVENIENVETEE